MTMSNKLLAENENGQSDNTELFRIYYSDEIQSLFYSDMSISMKSGGSSNTTSDSIQGNVFEFIWRYLVYLNATDL